MTETTETLFDLPPAQRRRVVVDPATIELPLAPATPDDAAERKARRYLREGQHAKALIAASYIGCPARQKEVMRACGMEAP